MATTGKKGSTKGGRTTPRKRASSNGNGATPSNVLSVEDLLKPALSEKPIDVPQLGGVVMVRSFTGADARQIQEESTVDGQLDYDKWERSLVLHGVSEPKLTPEQVEDLFNDQLAGVGRGIALHIMMHNAMGQAGDLVKSLGQTPTLDSDLSLPNFEASQ